MAKTKTGPTSCLVGATCIRNVSKREKKKTVSEENKKQNKTKPSDSDPSRDLWRKLLAICCRGRLNLVSSDPTPMALKWFAGQADAANRAYT